jgi:cathepsin F
MGLIVPVFPQYNYVINFTNDPNYKPKSTTPDIWNWQQQGAVGPIKDQGSCGSCWTFSTAGNIESLQYLKDTRQGFVTLSEQQLIDCDKTNEGCAGGWPYKAIDWLANNGGLMNDKDYPLRTNYSGPCQYNSAKQRV